MVRIQPWACMLVWVAWAFPAGAAVRVTDGPGPEGKRVVVVENAAMRLTVDPAQGGRVSGFVWKATGKDWVLPGNAGFFMDHVWQQTWPGELLSRPYEVAVIEPGPDRATVQAAVTIEGKGDKAIEGVRLTRTLTVTGDSPRLDVTIRLDNPTPEPRAPGLWVQNVINVGGSRDGVWTWRPTTRGVLRASFDTKTGKPIPAGYQDDFAFDPVAGWTAETYPSDFGFQISDFGLSGSGQSAIGNRQSAIGKGAGEGVVFFMDYNTLRCLYDNAGAQSVEWWYEPVHLAPGKSFETKVVMWPFSGLSSITYASLSLLGDLQMAVQGRDLILVNRLVAGPEPVAGPAKVKLELLDYDTGQVLQAKEWSDVTANGTPLRSVPDYEQQTLPIPKAPLAKNLLARATVTAADGKAQVYENYRPGPAVLGTEKRYKTARPPRVRPIERPAVITKTPHEGLRILHLRGLFQHYYRLPEVAKALGAELQVGSYRVFVYGPSLSYFPSDYLELMGYDAIVMNNVPLEALDDQTQQYLADYVEHGGALLVIGGHWAFGGGGYRGSRFEELLPATTKGPFDVVPVKQGLLTPPPPGGANVGTAWLQDVTPRPEAQVPIRAGGQPFWIQWKRGQGVVAVMAGVCYGEATEDLTPFWEWPGWSDWLAGRVREMVAETMRKDER